MNFDKIQELLVGLFSDPKATMYKAREEEYRIPTLTLAATGILLSGVVTMIVTTSGWGLLVGIILGTVGFGGYVMPIYLGGFFTGGTGGFLNILQLCGLAWLPLGLLTAITKIIGLDFVGSLVSIIIGYFLILIGHNFSSFSDVKFAMAVTFFFSIISSYVNPALLKIIFVAIQDYSFSLFKICRLFS